MGFQGCRGRASDKSLARLLSKKKKGGGRKNSSQGCEKSVDRSVESAETKQQIVCEINRLAAARVVTPRLVVCPKKTRPTN